MIDKAFPYIDGSRIEATSRFEYMDSYIEPSCYAFEITHNDYHLQHANSTLIPDVPLLQRIEIAYN